MKLTVFLALIGTIAFAQKNSYSYQSPQDI